MAALLTQVKEIWSLTAKVDMYTSKWHGWYLTYLTKACFSNRNLKRSHMTPYKSKFIDSIANFMKKIRITSSYTFNPKDIVDKFSDHSNIHLAELKSHCFESFDHSSDVVIFYNDYDSHHSFEHSIEEFLSFTNTNQDVYDLRSVQCSSTTGSTSLNNWKAELYSRRGGSLHGSWWKQDRRSKFCLKTTDGSLSDISDVSTIDVLVYVRLSSVERDNLRKEFLR